MTIDQMIEVLQAAKAGKVIEFRSKGFSSNAWRYDGVDHTFNFGLYDYRVKPEPREWVAFVMPDGHLLTTFVPEGREKGYIRVREVL